MKAKNLGVLSAVFASVCCLGPLILVLVGLGGLGISAVIGKYHWWFLGAGILLIVTAWRYYFKEKKTCDLKGCQMENKTRTLIILITVTLIVTFFVALNLYTYVGKPSSTRASSSNANLEIVTIPVKGITCFSCEVAVSSALIKLEGVVETTASAKEGNAKVKFDPTKINIKQLIEVINKTGYKANMP